MVSSVSVGMVVAGRYTLERCINRGGIGSLWLARDEQSDSYCGLRLAEGTGQGIVELAARYLAEVDVVGRIRCENVVDVLDYGEWNGLPFLAVEHVEGEELSAVLLHKGSMQPKVAYRIVAQTARALARAHAAGIVHGDLSPENILITSDGMQPMAKVFNFGLSQRGQEVGLTNAPRIGSFLRMPYYSSPEQIANQGVDWRSDLWSLGVVCYECLVGRRPFDSNNFAELLALISCEPIAPFVLPSGRSGAALEAWWAKATARDPAARFQSAKEMADALGRSFGFPLVFVPEPTSALLGPQASPAALPIVLRDSSMPPPGQSGRPSGRALTPNPKLKSGPPLGSGRPMQVAVRSSPPNPDVNTPFPSGYRHTTEIGLGSVVPPNRPGVAGPVRSQSPPRAALPAFEGSGASRPPSGPAVDVDVVSAATTSSKGSAIVAPPKQGSVDEEEEFYDGFPLSEAPTVARKPPEPARRVVLKGSSSDPPSALSGAPKARHRAAWFTATAIVIAGTIAAARLVRTDARVAGSGAPSVARDVPSVGSSNLQGAGPSGDAGPGGHADEVDDDVPGTGGSQLEAALAEEIARVSAAAKDAATDLPLRDVAPKPRAKPAPIRSTPRSPRAPAKPATNPSAQSPSRGSPPAAGAPTPSEPKPTSPTPVEREYGI